MHAWLRACAREAREREHIDEKLLSMKSSTGETVASTAHRCHLESTYCWLSACQPQKSIDTYKPQVQQVDATHQTVAQWFPKFVEASNNFTCPVRIINGVHSVGSPETLQEGLHECAHLHADVDIIPYGNAFKLNSRPNPMTWREYCDATLPDKRLYFFTHFEPYEQYLEFQLLDRLLGQLPNTVYMLDSAQVAIGGTGTGAPVHFHRPAFNFLLQGEKEWFLFPMGESMWSNMPIEMFIEQELPERREHCTFAKQNVGDIMFVPGQMGHGVRNTERTIAIAQEVNTLGFVCDSETVDCYRF